MVQQLDARSVLPLDYMHRRYGERSNMADLLTLTHPVLPLPLPRFLLKKVCIGVTWFIAVPVAGWLLGYKQSYPEYHKPLSE